MARHETYSTDQVIAAAAAGKGKTGKIASILGCTPETVRNYALRHQAIDEAIQSARYDFDEGLIDTAELKLEEAVLRGDRWAVQYTLDTKGRQRGYSKVKEISYTVEDMSSLSDEELRAIIDA